MLFIGMTMHGKCAEPFHNKPCNCKDKRIIQTLKRMKKGIDRGKEIESEIEKKEKIRIW